MGFFKDFKEDLSQAVNELLPEEVKQDEDGKHTVNTQNPEENASQADDTVEAGLEETSRGLSQDGPENKNMEDNAGKLEGVEGKDMEDNVDLELVDALNTDGDTEKEEELAVKKPELHAASVSENDELTVITKGTTINGSISSDGSLEVNGEITGDITCLGKLTITGKVSGNISAAEVYVNTDRLEGSISSEGSVKISLGTVVIGDVSASSGVIAGAVKGEMDINGPIVIDSTAIIKGNIKAKSVQINNGAVIEGFCSLSYSSVDTDAIFE